MRGRDITEVSMKEVGGKEKNNAKNGHKVRMNDRDTELIYKIKVCGL